MTDTAGIRCAYLVIAYNKVAKDIVDLSATRNCRNSGVAFEKRRTVQDVQILYLEPEGGASSIDNAAKYARFGA